MPFNLREQILCGLGCCCVGAATVFYRRKQTTAFKVLSNPLSSAAGGT